MRTTRLLISVIMFALSLNGWCEVFSVDRIRYSTLRGDSSVSVEYYLYEGDIVIPSTVTYNEKSYSVTSIGSNAFLGRYLVTSVTIPEGVTRIGDSAFSGCTGLTSMTIPSSVTSIENHVFSGCNNLKTLHYNAKNASWYNDTFSPTLLMSLKSLILGQEVENIPSYVIRNTPNLTSIEVNKDNKVYDSRDNCNAIIKSQSNTLTMGCANTIIPNSVASIGIEAFYDCSNLTSVIIPEGVTNIEDYAFYYCKLRSVVCKAANAPSLYSARVFSSPTLYHTTLLVPVGAWDNYAYDDKWYSFINIREAAMDTESISNARAFTIRDIESDSYLCYDKVNGTIGTIGTEGLDENEPNDSWMVTTVEGKQYVYNLGAKKYLVNISANANARRAASTQNAFTLADIPTPISISNGDSGIKVGNSEFYFVINDNLNVEKNLENKIEEATGIAGVASDMNEDTPAFSIDGRKVTGDKSGIIIKNGKKYIK